MVFSNFELALARGQDVVDTVERDLYLCRVSYPSGEEYVLKPHLPLGFSCINCFRLNFKHHFQTKSSAERAAVIFGARMGVNVESNPVTYKENNYDFISHYELCLTQAH